MPALTQAQFDTLTTIIEAAFHRHRQFSPCELTRKDIVEGFVNPEDWEIQKRASEIFESRFKYTNERINLHFSTPHYQKPLLLTIALSSPASLPDYAMNSPKLGDSAEHRKVTRALSDLADLYYEYNRMTVVLTKLNEICANVSQVAFIWPAIRDLAALAKEENHKVETLLKGMDKKTAAPMPRVSQALKEACRSTGTTLTVLKMLGEAPPFVTRDVDVWPGNTSVRFITDRSLLEALA